jgi:hypothetical protein
MQRRIRIVEDPLIETDRHWKSRLWYLSSVPVHGQNPRVNWLFMRYIKTSSPKIKPASFRLLRKRTNPPGSCNVCFEDVRSMKSSPQLSRLCLCLIYSQIPSMCNSAKDSVTIRKPWGKVKCWRIWFQLSKYPPKKGDDGSRNVWIDATGDHFRGSFRKVCNNINFVWLLLAIGNRCRIITLPTITIKKWQDALPIPDPYMRQVLKTIEVYENWEDQSNTPLTTFTQNMKHQLRE